MKKVNLISKAEMKKVLGGAAPGVCDDWRSNPSTCLNCCITVHSKEYCDKAC